MRPRRFFHSMRRRTRRLARPSDDARIWTKPPALIKPSGERAVAVRTLWIFLRQLCWLRYCAPSMLKLTPAGSPGVTGELTSTGSAALLTPCLATLETELMKVLHATLFTFCATAALAVTSLSFGASLAPLASFGGDGWLAPGELGFNAQTNSTVRGMTYNPATNHLYVVDRDGGLFVDILDGDTGMQVGSLDVTGISGGTFALSMIDVADDGAIYAANLSTSATSNFKVYRWASEGAAPTVAFDGPANRGRTGDSFAVVGAGANTQIVSAGGSNAGDDFALLTTADGLTFSVSNPTAAGAATGAFRLGIDLDGAGNVLGAQTGALVTQVAVSGGAATAYAVNSAGEALLDFDPTTKYLATLDFNSSDVRLYDGSDLSALTAAGFLDLANNTTANVANGNGVGDLKFGAGPDGLRLYALNTNNGIQAFRVVPEPIALALAGWGAALTCLLRRRWS